MPPETAWTPGDRMNFQVPCCKQIIHLECLMKCEKRTCPLCRVSLTSLEEYVSIPTEYQPTEHHPIEHQIYPSSMRVNIQPSTLTEVTPLNIITHRRQHKRTKRFHEKVDEEVIDVDETTHNINPNNNIHMSIKRSYLECLDD